MGPKPLRVMVLGTNPGKLEFAPSRVTGPKPVLLTVSASEVEGMAKHRARGAEKNNARNFIVYLSSYRFCKIADGFLQ